MITLLPLAFADFYALAPPVTQDPASVVDSSKVAPLEPEKTI